MPMPVSCRRCGRVADAFGGTMERATFAFNEGRYVCAPWLRERCDAGYRAREIARRKSSRG